VRKSNECYKLIMQLQGEENTVFVTIWKAKKEKDRVRSKSFYAVLVFDLEKEEYINAVFVEKRTYKSMESAVKHNSMYTAEVKGKIYGFVRKYTITEKDVDRREYFREAVPPVILKNKMKLALGGRVESVIEEVFYEN
jgi:hypothetical protein